MIPTNIFLNNEHFFTATIFAVIAQPSTGYDDLFRSIEQIDLSHGLTKISEFLA
jgi:hypothetical protein